MCVCVIYFPSLTSIFFLAFKTFLQRAVQRAVPTLLPFTLLTLLTRLKSLTRLGCVSLVTDLILLSMKGSTVVIVDVIVDVINATLR